MDQSYVSGTETVAHTLEKLKKAIIAAAGLSCVVVWSGHGTNAKGLQLAGASGDWVCSDGTISFPDIYNIFSKVDHMVDYDHHSTKRNEFKNPMKGCLTLICDNCFAGAFCHLAGWLTAEYYGFEGEGREDTTSRKSHEPLRRVFIQAASGRAG